MPHLTDEVLLLQLRNEVRNAYDLLYSEYFPSVMKHILQNSGSNEDAEDIFHDTVLIFLQKIRQPEFVLTSSLKTYLFAIARNLWLKKLKKDKQLPTSALPEHVPFVDDYDGTIDSSYKVDILLTRITLHCRRVIKAIFIYRVSMESLMQKMGWKNRHTAANQQYKCIQQMKRERALDPELQ